MILLDDGTPTGNPCVVPFERFEEHRLKLECLRRRRRELAECEETATKPVEPPASTV